MLDKKQQKLVTKTDYQFNTKVFITRRKQHKSFCYDHCDVNLCNPYKATHFKNPKSILHFLAFMVLHTDYYHNDHINHRISIAWFLV